MTSKEKLIDRIRQLSASRKTLIQVRKYELSRASKHSELAKVFGRDANDLLVVIKDLKARLKGLSK